MDIEDNNQGVVTQPPAPVTTDFDWGLFPKVAEPKEGQRPPDWELFPKVDMLKRSLDEVESAIVPGLVRGGAGVLGLPGELSRGVEAARDYLLPPPKGRPRPRPPEGERLPTGDEIIKHVEENWTGPLAKPQTPIGELSEAFWENVPGAIGMGGVVGQAARTGAPIARTVIQGLAEQAKNLFKFAAVPTAGGEVGEALAPKELKGAGRVGGAVVGGAGAGILMTPVKAHQLLRQSLPEYVTPQVVMDAGALMRDAERQGVRLTWPEALSQTTGRDVLLDTQRYLESAPHSARTMKDAIGNRARDSVDAARRSLDTISPQPAVPEIIGPAAGRAASEQVNDARAVINDATDRFYRAAESIRLTPAEYRAAQRMPGWREARDAIRGDPQLNRYVQHLPDDSVGFLNEVKKYSGERARGEASVINPQANQQRSAGYGADETTARQIALDASERDAIARSRARGRLGMLTHPPVNTYQVALDAQAQARQQSLEPLLAGPIGKLAQQDITTRQAIEALFPKNAGDVGEASIRDAVTSLSRRNPDAARMLVRHYLDTELDAAINKAGRTQGAAEFAGAAFAKNVTGSPIIETAQLRNLRAAVESLPNGQRTWQGLDRMFEVQRATGMRMPPGSKTAFNMQIEEGLGQSGIAGETAKLVLSPAQWFKKADQAISRWQAGKNLDELAHILTDPRAEQVLSRLSQLPRNSPQAPYLIARLVAIGETARRSSQPQDEQK